MLKVYGCSDDLIELEGDISEEFSSYDEPTLLVFSDGTVLVVNYGKNPNLGIWDIGVVRRGDLFEGHTVCMDEDADPYSDVVTLKDGASWVYAAKAPKRVKAQP